MRSFTRTAFVLLGVVTLAAAHLTMGSQTRGRVVVSYAVGSPISLHEPIFVEFSIQNGLTHQIRFDLGKNRKSKFLVTVTEPNGSVIRVPSLSEEGFGIGGRILLEPRQTYSQELLLNEWYDFSQPGDYKVDIRLAGSIVTEGGKNVDESTKGTLSIEITPRDPELLKRRCQALVKQVTESSEYAKRAKAALALSHVKDALAVPYLEKVLMASQVAPIAIVGLERIADPKAVDVLILALKSQSRDIVDLVRAALARIEKKTLDPQLKQRIRHAQ